MVPETMRILRCLRPFACWSAAVLVSFLVVSLAEACPGCKDAVAESDPDQVRMARGYFWSILFMLSMPFAILGTFGTYVYLEVRRARADRDVLEGRESERLPPAD